MTSDTCSMFQLYFYKILLDPLHNSDIINDDNLTKNTVVKLLNEFFSLKRQESKSRVEGFTAKHSITSEWKILKAVQGLPILVYPKLLTLDSLYLFCQYFDAIDGECW